MGAFAEALRAAAAGRRILENEPMSRHTSFRIGGPADFLAMPESAEELSALLEVSRLMGEPTLVIGNGTNLLVSDSGVRGLVIRLAGALTGLSSNGTEIEARAGTLLSKTAAFARDRGLSGLEFAHGIPGSVGGGVCMNAGAYDGELGGVLIRSLCLDGDGRIFELDREGHDFGRRRSFFTDHPECVVLSSVFSLEKGDGEEIQARMDDFRTRRALTQPLEYPSAGSVFKRPEGHFAGKLISDCGLKGLQAGGARVSDMHAGFIINTGGATCADVLELIERIQETVYTRLGVTLESEVKVIGA